MVCPWKGMKFENTKTRVIHVRVDDETLNKLDEITKKRGVSRSDVLREMIDLLYFDKIKKE